MANIEEIRSNIKRLENKTWNVKAIEAKVNNLLTNGIPKKRLDPEYIISNKSDILDRVQKNAEEYNYTLKNCAQSSALAVMEEFGLGNTEVISAIKPFPGYGGTGDMCGAVTGSLVAFGLFFGSDDRLDYNALNITMSKSQEFMAAFKDRIGYYYCSDIKEQYVFNDREESNNEKEVEKCSFFPGVGARIVAEFIIKSIEEEQRENQ